MECCCNTKNLTILLCSDIALIEWPDRLGGLHPAWSLDVVIEPVGKAV